MGRIPSIVAATVPIEMQARLHHLVMSSGEDMCRRILHGMIFTFPRDCVTDGAGALMTLIEIDSGIDTKNYDHAAVKLIENGLLTLPSDISAPNELTNFVKHLKEYPPSSFELTVSAEKEKDFRKIQRHIQDLVAIYRRRAIKMIDQNRRNEAVF